MPQTREASAMAVTLVDAAMTAAANESAGDPCFESLSAHLEAEHRKADVLAYIGQLEMRCEEMAQKLAPRIPSLVEWR